MWCEARKRTSPWEGCVRRALHFQIRRRILDLFRRSALCQFGDRGGFPMAGKIVLQEHWGVAMPTAAGSIQTLYIYTHRYMVESSSCIQALRPLEPQTQRSSCRGSGPLRFSECQPFRTEPTWLKALTRRRPRIQSSRSKAKQYCGRNGSETATEHWVYYTYPLPGTRSASIVDFIPRRGRPEGSRSVLPAFLGVFTRSSRQRGVRAWTGWISRSEINLEFGGFSLRVWGARVTMQSPQQRLKL